MEEDIMAELGEAKNVTVVDEMFDVKRREPSEA